MKERVRNNDNWIMSAIIAVALLLYANPIQGALREPPIAQTAENSPSLSTVFEKDSLPPYSKTRFIVKFKSKGDYALEEDAALLLQEKKAFERALKSKSDSIDKLNERFGVQAARSLFIKRNGLTTAKARAVLQRRLANARENLRRRLPYPRKHSPQVPQVDLTNVYILEISEGVSVETAISAYQNDMHVEYAQPDYQVELSAVPNDEYFSSWGSWGQLYDDLWGLKSDKLNMVPAWDLSKGQNAVVAVVDSGLDYSHPDISQNVWENAADPVGDMPDDCDRVADPTIALADDDCNGYVDDVRGWDFADGDDDPMDVDGHGTHVSGTIAAVGDNAIGIIGVAPEAIIMPLKAFPDQGTASIATLAEAIVYAAENGADVINNSWGCSMPCPWNPIAEEAVRVAHESGLVVVFSAANDSSDVINFSPQNMKETIAVAASDMNDEKTYFSNYGILLDVTAPGGGLQQPPPAYRPVYNILSLKSSAAGLEDTGYAPCIVGEDYLRLAGTSMSGPHVAGLAALIRSHRPDFTNEEIRQAIRVSADDVETPGIDLNSGAGRINAYNALNVDSVLTVEINEPISNEIIDMNLGPYAVTGTAAGEPGYFEAYQLLYNTTENFGTWLSLGEPSSDPVEDDILLPAWEVGSLATGSYVLRLLATATDGLQFEDYTQVHLWKNDLSIEQITDDVSRQAYASISGNRIVWEDLREGSPRLYYREGIDGEDIAIPQVQEFEISQLIPEISGDHVIWVSLEVDPQAGQLRRLFHYNIATDELQELQVNLAHGLTERVGVDGNFIVYCDDPEGDEIQSDIYLYKIDSGETVPITNDNSVSATKPDVFSDETITRVAWEERDESAMMSHLYYCEFDSLTHECPKVLIDSSARYFAHGGPRLSAQGVVFAAKSEQQGIGIGYVDLKYYDFLTGETQVISEAIRARTIFSAFSYNISGPRIVWGCEQEGGMWGAERDIYLYDLEEQEELRVTTHPMEQIFPDISGPRVVWQDNRNGTGQAWIFEDNWDIYMYEVNEPPVLDPIGDKVVNEGELLEFTVTASDANARDELSFSASNLPEGAEFEETTQTFSWTPAYHMAGTYESVHFEVTDEAEVDAEEVTITVEDVPDPDGDGVPDGQDNCTLVANGENEDADNGCVGSHCVGNQVDADGDDYGNICDADFDNTGRRGQPRVELPDLATFLSCNGQSPPITGGPEADPTCEESDLNADGVVGELDFTVFQSLYGKSPGPSDYHTP